MHGSSIFLVFFFFNDTATTEIYTLSLHDALPICDPAAFGLPDDVIIIWPDDNDGHMRGLPTDLGRWKHGVYYHLAYLGGNLSKQTTHTVAPATIAGGLQRIVQSRSTEYMLVNVPERRDYILAALVIAAIL